MGWWIKAYLALFVGGLLLGANMTLWVAEGYWFCLLGALAIVAVDLVLLRTMARMRR